jgi:hypothetical protein
MENRLKYLESCTPQLVYGGTYRYLPVCTGMYSSIVHTGRIRTFGIFAWRYIQVLVQTNDQKYVRVRTRTYFWQYKAVTVYGSTRRFMEEQGSI